MADIPPVNARAKLMQQIEELSLLDATFQIKLWNVHRRSFGPPPHPEQIASDRLSARFPEAKIAEAERKVDELLKTCMNLGEAFHDDPGKYERGKARLQRTHPGFGADSYDQAISYGLYLAR